MARIVFAWELGAGLGHAMACATLARALEARGHGVAFVFREPRALPTLGMDGRAAFQAPHMPREGEGQRVPVSWPDVLAGCGYARTEDLAGLVGGWIELLGESRGDLLVADYAPTALLAARILGLPRVSYGSGFSVPPRAAPMPAFRIDMPVDAVALAAREAAVLENVNRVLASWKSRPLAALHEQLDVSEQFLCTFPELDHYGERPRSVYWGPHYSIDVGADIAWPYGEGPRVLLYLHANLAPLGAIVDMLVAQRCRVVAYVPGLDAATRARLQSAQRRVSEKPVHLRPLLRDCDLFLNHGGTVAAGALMEGTPQLLFPAQYEQFLGAMRCEQLGAAMKILPGAAAAQLAAVFTQALRESPRLRLAAQTFRKRYAAFSTAEQEKRIVARIEELVGEART